MDMRTLEIAGGVARNLGDRAMSTHLEPCSAAHHQNGKIGSRVLQNFVGFSGNGAVLQQKWASGTGVLLLNLKTRPKTDFRHSLLVARPRFDRQSSLPRDALRNTR